MQKFFADAILPPSPPRVLGVALRPYSLGHSFILSAARNPYLYGQRGPPARLIEAVYICSASWPVPLAPVDVADPIRRLTRRAAQIRPLSRWQALEDSLILHFKSGHVAPERWEDPEEKQDSQQRTPWPLKLAALLVRNGAASRADVWNVSVAEAFAWSAAWRELDGDKSVLSDEELRVCASD